HMAEGESLLCCIVHDIGLAVNPARRCRKGFFLHAIFIFSSSFARSRSIDCPGDFGSIRRILENTMKRSLTLAGIGVALAGLAVFAVSGCNSSSNSGGKGVGTTTSGKSAVGDANLKGEIKIDGSSTVALISRAMVTNFSNQNPGVNISVGISGTGGGFKKFYGGEKDIPDDSPPIKPLANAQ